MSQLCSFQYISTDRNVKKYMDLSNILAHQQQGRIYKLVLITLYSMCNTLHHAQWNSITSCYFTKFSFPNKATLELYLPDGGSFTGYKWALKYLSSV